MTTVFRMDSSRIIQEIIFTTNEGRKFTLHIEEADSLKYESEIVSCDPLPPVESSTCSALTPASNSAQHNFAAGVDFVLKYLNQNGPKDCIADIHNPCNTPFISEMDQNTALSAAGVNLSVRIN